MAELYRVRTSCGGAHYIGRKARSTDRHTRLLQPGTSGSAPSWMRGSWRPAADGPDACPRPGTAIQGRAPRDAECRRPPAPLVMRPQAAFVDGRARRALWLPAVRACRKSAHPGKQCGWRRRARGAGSRGVTPVAPDQSVLPYADMLLQARTIIRGRAAVRYVDLRPSAPRAGPARGPAGRRESIQGDSECVQPSSCCFRLHLPWRRRP